ncbi:MULTISPECIES: arylesterase [unclassified Pedobacter]|uniref:arylesterase n=1 Tax=unclassified Pedobacter TaxID=2628915 RepID=UPI00209BD616|nr:MULTISPECIES: arylesterase [unclassified Pedobacter]MCX2431414.1 arylesterase [Pedobacter sp. GR22-10]MCX2584983.1 arylesterase [Pedobacter sp. MR22-3]
MMLRKRLTGLFVLALLFAACGNKQNKENQDQQSDTVRQTSKVNDQKLKNILFFGTSLTAGYGLDPTEAYPALIQNRIDSLKMPYKVINGGLSGETSAAGKSRISWLLKQPIDVFVLELGANDGLRGLPVAQTTKNLQSIIDSVRLKYPEVKMVMAGMQVPPNMGAQYAEDFKNIFPSLARKNNMALVPFLLDKVGGVPKLNQEDGIHPTAEGDKILAENVWAVLKDVLVAK